MGLEKYLAYISKTLYGSSFMVFGLGIYTYNVNTEVQYFMINTFLSILIALQGFIISKIYEHGERLSRVEEKLEVVMSREDR